MRKTTYLSRMRSLDRKFLDGHISKMTYDSKRGKLTTKYTKAIKQMDGKKLQKIAKRKR